MKQKNLKIIGFDVCDYKVNPYKHEGVINSERPIELFTIKESDIMQDHINDSLRYQMEVMKRNVTPNINQQKIMDKINMARLPYFTVQQNRQGGKNFMTTMYKLFLQNLDGKLANDYEFTVPALEVINWGEIASELNREKPLIHVTIGKEMYVIIFRDLALKAEHTHTIIPDCCSVYKRQKGYVIFHLEKHKKFERSFAAWNRWAKKVIKAKWPTNVKNETKIKVHIPKIR